jgi:hypothetical protein
VAGDERGGWASREEAQRHCAFRVSGAFGCRVCVCGGNG